MGIKKKSNFKRLFLKGFLRSFFIVAILSGTGILGYQAATNLGIIPNEESDVEIVPLPTPAAIISASLDDVSKNLIYCYDEETHQICKMVLEIFHSKKKQLTYITIPVQTRFTISESLYRRMILVDPELPQIMKFSALTGYLKEDLCFDYGELLTEDLLNMDISCYTVIPKTVYISIFTEKPSVSEQYQMPVECFSDEYSKFLKTIETEEELNNYLKELYPTLRSNLSLADKLKFLESCSGTQIENISFEHIPGEDYNSGFVIDKNLAAMRILELTDTGE